VTRMVQTNRHSQFCKYGLFLCAVFAGSTRGTAQTAPLPSSQREASPTISVASDLVLLPVNVTDARGNFVAGLRKENFKVYEEKHVQNLTLFQQEDTPVAVGLVVDHSASMESKIPNVSAAISAFAELGNLKDEMFVVEFNDKVNLAPLGGELFTSVASELEVGIHSLSASGRTALYDAVAEGINHLQLSHRQKKALIVISDGGDNASAYRRTDILKLAHQARVMIYSIILTNGQSKDENPKILIQLCRETGGVALLSQPQRSLTEFSLLIARDLREQYTLGFAPERKEIGPSFRKIDVQVFAPQAGKVNIRTRRGYFVGDRQPTSAHTKSFARR
jgi:Ca-activated chloride channel homolog